MDFGGHNKSISIDSEHIGLSSKTIEYFILRIIKYLNIYNNGSYSLKRIDRLIPEIRVVAFRAKIFSVTNNLIQKALAREQIG